MRVNVYAEETSERIELITKVVTEPGVAGVSETQTFKFYGLRFWLRFPNQPWWIHRKVDGEEDDDSSAVTIWAPNKDELKRMLNHAMDQIGDDND